MSFSAYLVQCFNQMKQVSTCLVSVESTCLGVKCSYSDEANKHMRRAYLEFCQHELECEYW
jgi:hypothetical protein